MCRLRLHVEFRVSEGETSKHLGINGSDHVGIHGTQATRLICKLWIEVVVILLSFLQMDKGHIGHASYIWLVDTNILRLVRRLDFSALQFLPVYGLEEGLALDLVCSSCWITSKTFAG